MNSSLLALHPTLRVSLRPGFARISCEMNGNSSIRVQTRIRGQEWRVLIDNWADFPVDDYTPVSFPGDDEIRDYRAIPVADGEEIGEPSEIVSVTVPG